MRNGFKCWDCWHQRIPPVAPPCVRCPCEVLQQPVNCWLRKRCPLWLPPVGCPCEVLGCPQEVCAGCPVPRLQLNILISDYRRRRCSLFAVSFANSEIKNGAQFNLPVTAAVCISDNSLFELTERRKTACPGCCGSVFQVLCSVLIRKRKDPPSRPGSKVQHNLDTGFALQLDS